MVFAALAWAFFLTGFFVFGRFKELFPEYV
jgi:hypothetical protein